MLQFMRSLKDIQNQRLETAEEFAAFLGISPQTYRRLLRGDPGIQNPTRRKIAEQIGVPAFSIVELIPPPSQAYLDSIDTAIMEANSHGWIVGDSETGLPTDTREYVQFTPDMQEQPHEQAA
ncbi:MAG: helix-turn-helix domain-containing protein [Roseiflexaceae bacterium]